ncbi:UNVERIFIED_CONTAM: hypothetical protein K2H54_000308 [Gekko kuhli]
MEELGLTLVDEGGLTLRQLMRQARQRIAGGGSAVAREIQHFIAELTDYLEATTGAPREEAYIQAEAMVTIVFSAGADALDMTSEECRALSDRTIRQLRMIAMGAEVQNQKRPLQHYRHVSLRATHPFACCSASSSAWFGHSALVKVQYPELGSNFFSLIMMLLLLAVLSIKLGISVGKKEKE